MPVSLGELPFREIKTMTTGTHIIERALQKIGAHSVVSPASPESIDLGLENLNSMMEFWLSKGIDIGATPLKVAGDELNEPPDAKNAIISNLAIYLASDFDNGKDIVTQALISTAYSDFFHVKSFYQRLAIPNKGVSSSLPVGEGNMRGVYRNVFFPRGARIKN